MAAPESLCHDLAPMPDATKKTVHVVSHGPHCLDGVTAAVAVARYFDERADVVPRFARQQRDRRTCFARSEPAGRRRQELWITDISWREPETDAHLRALAADGVRIYWIDHHRTALERVRAGQVDVPFTDSVLSRGVRGLAARLRVPAAPPAAGGSAAPALRRASRRWSPWPTTTTAGCTGFPARASWRGWSRALGPDAYEEFLALDERVTYTPRMAEARDRVGAEIARSFAGGRARAASSGGSATSRSSSRCATAIRARSPTPGEGRRRDAVFALYDAEEPRR